MALARAAEKRERDAKKKEVKNAINRVVLVAGDAYHFPKVGDAVSVHYTASLEDGIVFDTSYGRGQTLNFIIGSGQVIPGWDDILPTMSKGEKVRIIVPPNLAYGKAGFPPIIPPNSKVVYEIELISFSSESTV